GMPGRTSNHTNEGFNAGAGASEAEYSHTNGYGGGSRAHTHTAFGQRARAAQAGSAPGGALEPDEIEAGETQADAGTDGQLGQVLAELAEAEDRYVRLQADWDNYRKRTEAERKLERERAAAHLIERMLPVLDDLERAVEHSENCSVEQLTSGINAVICKFQEVLEREGVKVIDPLGEPFDLNLHNAVARIEDASLPDESVKAVYQKGYEMAGRVLRTAMVAVSTGGPCAPKEAPEAAQASDTPAPADTPGAK
ncbi:MAG: nucleotide exchange factor GrpE, partial [Coriobacteriia bacterium]|nr:nucleotide exchange factor GrpE [Coriobacteriia bacterium]